MSSRYSPRTRARDADRADACALIDAGFADGQLDEDEHRTLTGLAAEARTLGELQTLVEDLQRPVGAPKDARPPVNRRHRFTAGVAVVAVAAAVACFVSVRGGGAPAADPSSGHDRAALDAAAPLVVPTPNLVTTAGIALFIANYRAKFGDTIVDELNLYKAGHANVERSQPQQPNRLVRYDYRGGFTASAAPTTRKVDTPTVDLAALALDRFAGILAGAATSVGVPNGTVDYISIDNDSGAPTVSIYVGNTFNESGRIELAPSGEVRRVSPFHG